MDWIVRNSTRNKFINNLVKDLEVTLVLFQFVEKHSKPLFKILNKLDRKVFFVFSGTCAIDREELER